MPSMKVAPNCGDAGGEVHGLEGEIFVNLRGSGQSLFTGSGGSALVVVMVDIV